MLRLLSANGPLDVTGATARFYITLSGKINRNEGQGGDGRGSRVRKIMLNMAECCCIASLGPMGSSEGPRRPQSVRSHRRNG
jgi:hypothetical protein